MEIINTYDPTKDAAEVRNQSILTKSKLVLSIWFERFKKNFNEDRHELLIANIIICLFSVIISLIITFLSNDAFKIVSTIIDSLITYFSITIGFSLATLTFIIENLRKINKENEKDENDLLKKILSLIVIYILHGVFMIGIFILELILGNIIFFNGIMYYIINIGGITFYSIMVIFNLYIFCKIVIILYYFAILILKK
ncbi:hypothetical protein HMPREF2953_07665 [Staphylococcus sp. HMSC072E01]|nr:hypothetical protein HMPREF2953_07665 [Staphylococcus sp. HMSC072E01]